MGIDATMFVRTKQQLTDNEILATSRALAEAIGPEHFFFFFRDADYSEEVVKKGKFHVLSRVQVWDHHDAAPIEPEPGETFLSVSLRTRFYGVGYERGDLVIILAVSEWLQSRLSGAAVWYGGDSSGAECEPLGRTCDEGSYAAKLWQHFVASGHAPYAAGRPFGGEKMRWPTCDRCKVPMVPHGSGMGGKFAPFYCGSCGLSLETRDGGETFANCEEEKSKSARALYAIEDDADASAKQLRAAIQEYLRWQR